MPFCVNCGQQINEESKFCTNCGEVVVSHAKPSPAGERKTIYNGEIRKCPSCGEVINSFVANCPSCGYELRGSLATGSVQRLYWELNRSTSIEQKAMIIRNYPIPNAKEDIIEFMILTSSNISGEADKSIFEAWVAKFEQVHQKAQMTLRNDPVFSQINEIYEKTERAITKEKISRTTAIAGDMVIRYFKVMPNPVFAIVVVLLVIFNLIRLFNGQFTDSDIMFDAIILGATYRITEKKKKAKQENTDALNVQEADVNKVKVPSTIVGGTSKNYAVVESIFIQAGFTNVRTIPLTDLIFGVKKKVGTVDSITIDGKKLSTYFRRKFDADVPVLITYHSLRR